MSYAVALDVQNRLGRELTPEETTLVATRLADVERMILTRIPNLANRIADGLPEATVIQVEADAVLRVVRNPEGLYAETDGNYSYQLDREHASGRLELLPHEWVMLGENNATGAFFIDVRPRVRVPHYVPFGSGG